MGVAEGCDVREQRVCEHTHTHTHTCVRRMSRCCARGKKQRLCAEQHASGHLLGGGEAGGHTPTPASARSSPLREDLGEEEPQGWSRRGLGEVTGWGMIISNTQMPPLRAALFAGRLPNPRAPTLPPGERGWWDPTCTYPPSIAAT